MFKTYTTKPRQVTAVQWDESKKLRMALEADGATLSFACSSKAPDVNYGLKIQALGTRMTRVEKGDFIVVASDEKFVPHYLVIPASEFGAAHQNEDGSEIVIATVSAGDDAGDPPPGDPPAAETPPAEPPVETHEETHKGKRGKGK
jgi:hypothetical protein